MKRLLTAAVGIPILFVVIKKGPVWVLFALVAACAVLATREACLLLERPARRPLTWLAMAASVAVGAPFASAAFSVPPSILFTLPIVLSLGAILLAACLARETTQEVVEASLATLFPVLFVGLPLG